MSNEPFGPSMTEAKSLRFEESMAEARSFPFEPSMTAANSLRLPDTRRTSVYHNTLSSDEEKALSQSSSLATDIVAATLCFILEVVNCVSIAVILRGSWPVAHLGFLYQHTVFGFVMVQLVTTMMSQMRGVVAPCGFENITIFLMVRTHVVEAMKEDPAVAQMVTFLTCASGASFLSAVVLALMSIPRFAELLHHFPNDVRHGVFAAIGYGTCILGFGSFGLDPFNASSWTTGLNWLKWFPGYVIGFTMWYVDSKWPSRWLFVGFVISVICGAQGGLALYGLSLSESASRGWLLGELGNTEFVEYFHVTYGSIHLVNWNVVLQALPTLLLAAFVGPILQTAVNVLVLEDIFKIPLDCSREIFSQALGSLLSGLAFGWNSYFAVADTTMMQKGGGKTSRAVLVMLFLMMLSLAMPSILPTLALIIPILLPAALFVYIGVAIMIGCLQDMRAELEPLECSFSLFTFVVCVRNGVGLGLLIACSVRVVQRLMMGSTSSTHKMVQPKSSPLLFRRLAIRGHDRFMQPLIFDRTGTV